MQALFLVAYLCLYVCVSDCLSTQKLKSYCSENHETWKEYATMHYGEP